MKRFLTTTLVLLASVLTLNFTSVALATAATICGEGDSTSKGQVLQGAGQTGTDCDGTGVTSLASAVVQILSIIVGIIAVIMIIVSGLKYTTSGGDSGKVASAKTTLIYALVGLAIAVLAQFIVHFTINNAADAVKGCPAGQTADSSGTCK